MLRLIEIPDTVLIILTGFLLVICSPSNGECYRNTHLVFNLFSATHEISCWSLGFGLSWSYTLVERNIYNSSATEDQRKLSWKWVIKETFFVHLAITFLGASVKLRTATVGFVISARPPVYTLAITRLPLGGFLWHLIFEYFRKSILKIQFYLHLTRITRTLLEYQYKFLNIPLSVLLRMKHASDKVVGKIKTRILFKVNF
jgi:hypothetical protein